MKEFWLEDLRITESIRELDEKIAKLEQDKLVLCNSRPWQVRLISNVFYEGATIPLLDEDTISFLFTKLDERTVEVIRCRYEQGMTYEAIGRKLGISLERVRQIEHKGEHTIRKIARRVIKRGIEEENRWSKSNEEIMTIMKKTEVDELQLSVRAYNALRRRGVRTVGDLYKIIKSGELENTIGIGGKSVEEIKEKYMQYIRAVGYD